MLRGAGAAPSLHGSPCLLLRTVASPVPTSSHRGLAEYGGQPSAHRTNSGEGNEVCQAGKIQKVGVLGPVPLTSPSSALPLKGQQQHLTLLGEVGQRAQVSPAPPFPASWLC